MVTYPSWDGSELCYRVSGSGDPLIVVPGGPGRDADYLGDLGGLAEVAGRTLVVPDLRGTGGSPMPDDPSVARAARLARDVEALRAHLGLGAVDVLGHSAGGNIAMLYAAQFPERVSRLLLITPGTAAVGLDLADEEWEVSLERRAAEPWYAGARAAVDTDDNTPELRLAFSPFLYSRWDDRAQSHAAADEAQRNRLATAAYGEGADDLHRTRERLSGLAAPVRVVVQPDVGHFPWVDDPAGFAALVATLLHE